MPNYVRSKIVFDTNVTTVLERLRGKRELDEEFSFEWIIPSPKTIEECPEKYIKSGVSTLESIEGQEWLNWHDWRVDNWGTKWDCVNVETDDAHTLFFETAWSCPVEVFEKLAELIPDVGFGVYWADEALGSNTGEIHHIKDNSGISIDYHVDINDDLEFACDIWGLDYQSELEWRIQCEEEINYD